MSHADELYREIILDHYRSTRNRRPLEPADHRLEGVNPSCGDEIVLYLNSDGERITEVTYSGNGCSISLASASMLCDALTGATVAEARDLLRRMKGMLTNREEPDFPERAEDLLALQGVARLPARVKCALLSWNTLGEILDSMRETPGR